MKKFFVILLVVFIVGSFGLAFANKPDDGNNPHPDNPPCDSDHGHPLANFIKQGRDDKCGEDADNGDEDVDEDQDQDQDQDQDVDEDQDQDQDQDQDVDADQDQDQDQDQDVDADQDQDVDADQDQDVDADQDQDVDADQDQDVDVDADLDTDTQNLCTEAAGDPGLLTTDTLGQTLWDGGLSALTPLTEDPERNGVISGPLGDAFTGTPLEVVGDEAACLLDLLLDETVSPIDL